MNFLGTKCFKLVDLTLFFSFILFYFRDSKENSIGNLPANPTRHDKKEAYSKIEESDKTESNDM